MKLLVIDIDGLYLAFCWRCAQAGHEVRWFVRKGAELRSGKGFRGITRVDNWVASMDWADLVVPTGNSHYLQRLDFFRERGFPVYGPSSDSAELEIARGKGMEFLKKHGIVVPEYETFKSLKDAENYVKKTKERYVFKTLGDNDDKSLSHVSHHAADMVEQLRSWQRAGLNPKGEVMLQEFVPGIEFAVSCWMGKNGWVGKPNENFEHKKFMSGNAGPNTGEMGCYDEATEVLTNSGWKFWKDVVITDKIASLQGDSTVFVTPSDVVQYDYVGPMIHWKNQTLDICVTPNHNMYVCAQSDARKNIDNYKFVRAENCLRAQYSIKRTAHWEGSNQEYFELGDYSHAKGWGHVVIGKKKIPMLIWAKFLGVYIGDGYSNSRGRIDIAKSHPKKADKIAEILFETPFKWTRKSDGFYANSVQLAKHLSALGKSLEKYVPDYIKNGSTSIINAFLEGYSITDCYKYSTEFRVFYTSSKKLSDDVQELLLKIGRVGVIKTRQARKSFIGHREIVSENPCYEILERVKKSRSWLDIRDRRTVAYAGKVYCATVPGHVMYVRRNGKPFWCGNTVMTYTDKSKLFDDTLKKLEAPLLSLGHLGDVDINFIVPTEGEKAGIPQALEFTVRFGYPAMLIMMMSHKGDPAKWMLDAVNGKDSLEVSTESVVGLVVGIPPFPEKHVEKSKVEGNPVYGVTPKNSKYIQPCDVEILKKMDMQGSELLEHPMWVTTGPLPLVVTGTGKTVRQAADRAYGTLKELSISNKEYRDDIGEGLKESLPKLQSLGYAMGFTYEGKK